MMRKKDENFQSHFSGTKMETVASSSPQAIAFASDTTKNCYFYHQSHWVHAATHLTRSSHRQALLALSIVKSNC
jgi:hypothetical protein